MVAKMVIIAERRNVVFILDQMIGKAERKLLEGSKVVGMTESLSGEE